MTTAPERTADLYPTRGITEVATPRMDPVVWSEPGAPGPIEAAVLADYERDGFLAIDQLITPDEVETYRRELNRLTTDPEIRADERSIVEPKSQEMPSARSTWPRGASGGRCPGRPST